MYDPNYKLKYRPAPISRLSKRAPRPIAMVGDPEESRVDSWDDRTAALYEYTIAIKNGIVPQEKRHGVWFYADAPNIADHRQQS